MTETCPVRREEAQVRMLRLRVRRAAGAPHRLGIAGRASLGRAQLESGAPARQPLDGRSLEPLVRRARILRADFNVIDPVTELDGQAGGGQRVVSTATRDVVRICAT